ncbi:MAG: hypothetical protein ABJN69_03510 [Hellea sp.]
MVKIPGTAIEAEFHAPVGKYPGLFYSSPSTYGNMLSVNAGSSSGLYVGGGGINSGFEQALSAQKTSLYATRHSHLLHAVRNGGADIETYSDKNPMGFSMVDISHVIHNKNNSTPQGGNDGVCFVDIFGEDASGQSLCPHGVAQNTGMLYACPPHGDNYADDAAFLAAISQTGANTVTSIGAYNKIAVANHQPLISAIRLCLFSSVIFNPNKVDKGKIALAIFDGMSQTLVKDDCGLTRVEMPYSTNPADPMFAAVKTKIDP